MLAAGVVSTLGGVRVAQIWRYPVKSLQGETLPVAELGPQGVEGDRRYAIFDAQTGMGLTARREPALLFGAASLASGSLEITLPDGTVASDDAALSEWLGRPVILRSTSYSGPRRYESPEDYEAEADWEPFDGANGSFRDSERTVVSLVSTGTLGEWNARRFRSNLVLEGSDEDALVGTRVRVGGAELEVVKRVGRCVMVTRAQPDGVEKDLDVLRTIHRERGGRFAVGAEVLVPGTVSVGDRLSA
ncbi:MOSC N-terminal beta barrel domain-containing protein [Leifsonia sp. H3M29-4]|nr:MOSC N-terminal beta barrel domain-containing protein [Salinibacterium metalliresistens]